jgi:hypothetical protein
VLLFFVVFFFLVFFCLFFIMFHGLGGIPLIGWLGLFAVRSKVVMATTLEALSEAGCGSLMCRDVIFSSLGFKGWGRFARRRPGPCIKFVVVDQDVYFKMSKLSSPNPHQISIPSTTEVVLV